jgi:serine/threonine protein kinase
MSATPSSTSAGAAPPGPPGPSGASASAPAGAAPPGADDPEIGQVIDGRYRIVGLLGQGGMGAVYRAEHVGMGKMLAVKLLHPHVSTRRDAGARFQREAFASGRIDHPNCVAVSDFGVREDGSFYLVMELLQGESLREMIDRERRLPWPRALHIARHVLRGLAHAHAQGIIHRDIKPENIFVVRRDDDPDFAKVLDFGIAKLIAGGEGNNVTREGLVVGTPTYLSPEQAFGGELGAASDLYSLSVVLYEMLAGRPPFESSDPVALLTAHATQDIPSLSSIARDVAVPEAVELLVRKGLAKLRGQRFEHAEAYVAALDAVRDELGLHVPRPATSPWPVGPVSGQLPAPLVPPGLTPLPFATTSATPRPPTGTPIEPYPARHHTGVGMPGRPHPGSGVHPPGPELPPGPASGVYDAMSGSGVYPVHAPVPPHPGSGVYPVQGQVPHPGSGVYPVQGQVPHPGSGVYPVQGQVPHPGSGVYPVQGQVPHPGSGAYPVHVPVQGHPTSGVYAVPPGPSSGIYATPGSGVYPQGPFTGSMPALTPSGGVEVGISLAAVSLPAPEVRARRLKAAAVFVGLVLFVGVIAALSGIGRPDDEPADPAARPAAVLADALVPAADAVPAAAAPAAPVTAPVTAPIDAVAAAAVAVVTPEPAAPAPAPAPTTAPSAEARSIALKAALHDLEHGRTCAARKVAVKQLRELGDRRAVPHLRTARDRRGRNGNACLKADAARAIMLLQKKR